MLPFLPAVTHWKWLSVLKAELDLERSEHCFRLNCIYSFMASTSGYWTSSCLHLCHLFQNQINSRRKKIQIKTLNWVPLQ